MHAACDGNVCGRRAGHGANREDNSCWEHRAANRVGRFLNRDGRGERHAGRDGPHAGKSRRSLSPNANADPNIAKHIKASIRLSPL